MKAKWHSQGQHLIATKGRAQVSVLVPEKGEFTNARLWLGSFRLCVRMAQARLAVEEWRMRL